MPFRHIAMYRWADHVDTVHVDRVRAAFDALVDGADRVDGLGDLAHGPDVGVSEAAYDYLVVADFESVAEWRVFRDHPRHMLLVEELIVGHVAEQASGQFHIAATRSAHDLSSDRMRSLLAEPDDAAPTAAAAVSAPHTVGESDDELMARARRAAMAEMQALLAEPDDAGPPATPGVPPPG